LKTLETKVNQDKFSTRSEVNLTISENENEQEVSNLSVAVVHEAAFPENGVSQNILSALFIESELNGFIETPADFLPITNERNNQTAPAYAYKWLEQLFMESGANII
jgi:hypothetical protein